MADNTKPSLDPLIAADQLASGEYAQIVKVMDGTADSTNRWIVDSNGAARVSIIGTVVTGSNLTVKRAFANISAATTDGVVVAAVAGKAIRVIGLAFGCAGTATAVTFNTKPAGAGTAISATFNLGANGGWMFPRTQDSDGWLLTNTGEGLSATTGAGSTTAVQVLYVEV